MEIRISTPLGLSQKPKLAASSTLRVGDIVEARILEQKGNALSIKIGESTLSARLSGSLRSIPTTGRFEVVQVHPIPVLKIRASAIAANTSGIGQLARDVLPAQRPLQSLLDKITHLKHGLLPSRVNQLATNGKHHSSVQATQSSSALVSNRPNLLNQVLGHIENRVTELSVIVTVDGLRSALKNSGVFLESKLSGRGPKMLLGDLKAGLLQARQALSSAIKPQPLPTSTSQLAAGTRCLSASDGAIDALFKAVEAGIARIETLQLANHTLTSNGQNGLYLEIPLRAGNQFETIQLFVEQESKKDENTGQAKHTNVIYLEFKLSEEELLQAKITSQEEQISIALWSDSERIQHRLLGGIAALGETLSSSLPAEPEITVQAFPSKFLDPSKLFANLLSEKV